MACLKQPPRDGLSHQAQSDEADALHGSSSVKDPGSACNRK